MLFFNISIKSYFLIGYAASEVSFRIFKTSLLGGVSVLREITLPYLDAVKRYHLTSNQKELKHCSLVAASIFLASSQLT